MAPRLKRHEEAHQVFSRRRSMWLKNVISQISTRIARPIYQTSGGSWDSHTAAQANLRIAQKFITFSIANFQNADCQLDARSQKSASAEGRYSVNLRASVVKSKNAKEFHRSRTRHPLRSPAEEFLLSLAE